MNYGQIVKGFTSYIYDKSTSPFVWILLLCFFFDHWSDAFILFFSDENIHSKVAYLDVSIKASNFILWDWNSSVFYIVNPVLSAIIASAIYPFLSTCSSYFYDYFMYKRNQISHKFESKKYLTIEDSLELKNDRAQLVDTFTKQFAENQAHLREAQNKFLASQTNCSALFCMLGFSYGHEMLLSHTGLFESFAVKTPEQRDILIAINALIPNSGGLQFKELSSLCEEVKLSNFPSLRALSTSDIEENIVKLVSGGALRANFSISSGGKGLMKSDTKIHIEHTGRKFVQAITALESGNFQGALEIPKNQ